MRFHAKKANSSAEGDGALPCKGFLCSIFFALVLILLWTVKRCDLCLIPTMFPFYLFSPWTETFHNNMIRRSVLKNKGSIFIYFIPFCCLIFCGDFWDKLTAVLKVTMFCHARAFFVWFFFSLVFILLWTGKRCDICLIPMRFPFYLFSPWTEKKV
uniref:Uncharacterized protein n=1 Tax=Glycine max TaxID=3847 RepID=A0A0R0KL25_SOYBN